LNWSIVFGLNLILPLPLGILVTQAGGTLGLLAALFLCWAAGLVACDRLPHVVQAVTRGGVIVAAVQGTMIIHTALGIASAFVWQQVTGHSVFTGSGWRAEVDGFAVTVLVAQPLLGAAWLFGGGPARLVKRPPATSEEGDYLDLAPPDYSKANVGEEL
jgi:hypothetical protein